MNGAIAKTGDNVQLRCAVCSGGIRAPGGRSCPACHGVLHHHCWDWIGGCATFACGMAGSQPRRAIQYAYACAVRHRAMRKLECVVCSIAIAVALSLGHIEVAGAAAIALATSAIRLNVVDTFLVSIDSEDWSHREDSGWKDWLSNPRDLAPNRSLLQATAAHLIGPAAVAIDVSSIPIMAAIGMPTLTDALVGVLIWIVYRSSRFHYTFLDCQAERMARLWRTELISTCSSKSQSPAPSTKRDDLIK
jgi:hypothetical protein